MKTLLMLLILSPLSSLAASNVNVVIDGESFTCSKGGSASLCECKFKQVSGYHYYWIEYQGQAIQGSTGGYSTFLDAASSCKVKVKEYDLCRP